MAGTQRVTAGPRVEVGQEESTADAAQTPGVAELQAKRRSQTWVSLAPELCS